MKNRLLSVLLCLCMLISLIPAAPAVSAEAGTIRVLGSVSECEHDYTVKVTPPTCAARGYTTYTCTKCGATVITDEVDVLPHNYKDGFCTACGQRLLTVRFVCDAGVSVSVCKTPDMDGPLEDNAQTAHPINVANGQIDCSGEGEVSFIVVLQPGYELESVSAASADAYKNFKQPIETGVVNGYRLTKISDDVTVTVKVKQYNEHPDAFTVVFDCDEGVSVTTYEDQTRAGACEENATRAIARSGLTGAPDVSGKGQVNFLVVVSPDYTFDGITLEPVTSFGNVLFPSFLNIDNGFRITGITGDITVKVSAVKNGPQECRHDYVPKVTPPTCTEAGFTTYTCSKCGDSYVSDKTAPTGHEFCDQGFCTRCGMLAHKIEFICDPGVSVNVSRTLAAGGQIDENVSVAYPRDYSSGLIVMNGSGQVNFTVSVENGYRLESVNAVPADHYRTFRPPTAQQSPGTYRMTMISGDVTVTVKSSVIDPGTCTHDYQAEVVPPSCTAGGYTTYTCSICGDSYRADEQPRIAHNYVGGVCTVCGEKRINVRIVCGEGASVTVYETRKIEGAHEDNAAVVHPRSGDTGLEDGSGEGQVNFTVKLAEGYRIDGVSAAPASAFQDLLRPTDKGMTNGYRVTQIRGDLTITVKTSLAPCEHDYRAVTTPPTCTEAGYTTYTCAKCGYSYQADEVAALGHEYRSAVTQPTCTEKGFTTHTCARCGDAYIDGEREALGHNYKDAVIEPTCTGRGYTTHTCARCGDKYVDGEIDALGHDFKITVTPPNCTETGYTTYACTRCRYAYADHETPALGHDYVAAVTEPTCTAKGFTTYTCSRCGDHYVGEETPALGHEFRVEVTAPTCTDRGYTIHACTRCRYAYADHETPALGHDYQAVVTPPTCTEKGCTTYTCSRCGDSYVGGEKAALGHDYQATATQPTCT
ncbi:MAG: hypothetical protein IKT99_04935, partial [Oscillospiraceae bacterium]|nr:hypothetical protein [Oscillospiraceae bacterium]